jgi:hypothetical protein
MTTPFLRLLTAQIPLTAPAIDRSIAVEDFRIKGVFRYANAIAKVGNRGKIAHYDQIAAIFGTADKRHHRVAVIVAVNPLESIP